MLKFAVSIQAMQNRVPPVVVDTRMIGSASVDNSVVVIIFVDISITNDMAVLLLKTAPQATADRPSEHLKSETVGSFNSGIVASILGCWPLIAIMLRLINYLKSTNVYLMRKLPARIWILVQNLNNYSH